MFAFFFSTRHEIRGTGFFLANETFDMGHARSCRMDSGLPGLLLTSGAAGSACGAFSEGGLEQTSRGTPAAPLQGSHELLGAL